MLILKRVEYTNWLYRSFTINIKTLTDNNFVNRVMFLDLNG